MFGREGDQLERIRRERQSQYAAELRQQGDPRNLSTFRTNAAPQIVGFQPTPDAPRASYEPSSQRLDFLIERAVALEIPTRLKPIQDSLNALSGKFEDLTSSTQNALSTFRDKISELGHTVTSLNERILDDREKVQDLAATINRESSRTRDLTDGCLSRIQTLESRLVQLEDGMRGVNQRQQQSEDATCEQIGLLSSALSQTAAGSADRDRQIMAEVERLNGKTQSTFGRVAQQIHAAVSSSIALVAETRSAFETLRAEHENDISGLSQQLERSTAETAEVIGQLEVEVVQTCGHLFSLITAVEGGCSAELSLAKRNRDQLLESFRKFSVAIVEKIENDARARQQMAQDLHTNVGTICNMFFSAWKGELSAFLKDATGQVAECQAKTGSIEQRLAEHVIAVGKRQDEIIELLNKKARITISDSHLIDRVKRLEQVVAQIPQRAPQNMVNLQRKGHFRPPQVASPKAPGLQNPSDLQAQSDNEPVPGDVLEQPANFSVDIDQDDNNTDQGLEAPEPLPGEPMVETDLDLFADMEPSLMPCHFPDDMIVPGGPKPRGRARRRGRR
jgi:predicted  nucleic acid-binding Zn-ribbon protein